MRSNLILFGRLLIGLSLFLAFPCGNSVVNRGMASSQPSTNNPIAKLSQRIIVELKSPPVAVWGATSPGIWLNNGKINLQALEVNKYQAQLEAEQAAFIGSMQALIPGSKLSSFTDEKGSYLPLSFQIVFNGLAIEPGQNDFNEVRHKLMTLPGVKRFTLTTSTNQIYMPASPDQRQRGLLHHSYWRFGEGRKGDQNSLNGWRHPSCCSDV